MLVIDIAVALNICDRYYQVRDYNWVLRLNNYFTDAKRVSRISLAVIGTELSGWRYTNLCRN